MDSQRELQRAGGAELSSFRGRGWRLGQLFALLGLTGFAVSQPLLAVAGEDPSLFTVADVRGTGLILVALIVALVPPLVMWSMVVLIGRLDRRAGDSAFVLLSGLLVGLTTIQWAKTLGGIEMAWLLAAMGLLGAAGFMALLVRVSPVSLWTRYTAVLPVVAVVLLLVASPAADLLTSPTAAPARNQGGVQKPSVVFIMLDEFPLMTLLGEDRAIDADRFPNLARLADGSTWYRDYTVMADNTRLSIPSLLTGRIPSGEQPLWTNHPDSLFSLLAPTHDLNVAESLTQLCGYANCAVDGAEHRSGRGIRSVLGQLGEVWRDRVALGAIPEPDVGQFATEIEPLDPESHVREGAGRPDAHHAAVPAVMADFLGALDASRANRPTLSYLHLMLPHQPWSRYPDGREFSGWGAVELSMSDMEVDERVLAYMEQAHMYQAMYTDRLVGEIIDHLQQQELYDDALIVVTADHGVHFAPGRGVNLRRADRETMGSVAYVPLLIKSPGQREGRIDDSNLTAVDLLPTIAAEVGVDITWEVDGVPAGSPGIDERGDTKGLHAVGGEVVDVIDFESGDHRPDAGDRHLGPLEPGEHSLAALLRAIGSDQWLGMTIDEGDLEITEEGATLESANRLMDPSEPQMGRLNGAMESPVDGDVILLVLDGVVQSASPVSTDGEFMFFVPAEVETGADVEVHLVVSRDGELVGLGF